MTTHTKGNEMPVNRDYPDDESLYEHICSCGLRFTGSTWRRTCAKCVAALAEAAKTWTRDAPRRQDTYWHWNGDEDCAPLPYHVAYMGHSGKFAVMAGQYGRTHAENCEDMGGWWMLLPTPSTQGAKDQIERAGG